MAIVYIGVGSNLGDRLENIRTAFELLERSFIHIIKTSSIIETDPVGGPAQGKFLNCVIKTETILSPEELLRTLHEIEQKLGRTREEVNGPRTIDLDILLYDDLVRSAPELTIPHPRMLERSFVLEPLKEIEPDLVESLLHARR